MLLQLKLKHKSANVVAVASSQSLVFARSFASTSQLCQSEKFAILVLAKWFGLSQSQHAKSSRFALSKGSRIWFSRPFTGESQLPRSKPPSFDSAAFFVRQRWHRPLACDCMAIPSFDVWLRLVPEGRHVVATGVNPWLQVSNTKPRLGRHETPRTHVVPPGLSRLYVKRGNGEFRFNPVKLVESVENHAITGQRPMPSRLLAKLKTGRTSFNVKPLGVGVLHFQTPTPYGYSLNKIGRRIQIQSCQVGRER